MRRLPETRRKPGSSRHADKPKFLGMADDAALPDPTAWIAAFADRLGVEPPDEATVATLLDLAGVAAHASARTAAPIACWLVGRAGVADAGRAAVAELAQAR